jgi:DNA-binding transcriptional LysR family regulator
MCSQPATGKDEFLKGNDDGSAQSMRLFCAVVEKGSLAAAAEVLEMSTPMATKYLNALETRLGTRLIQRTSRQRRLTPSGENYYLQCKQALGLIDQAEADLIESTELPRGKLKVSALTWLIHPGFGGLVAAYRQQCPDVTLDLRLDEKLVDLVAEGFDIALRATQQPAPQLVARPVYRALCRSRFTEKSGDASRQHAGRFVAGTGGCSRRSRFVIDVADA